MKYLKVNDKEIFSVKTSSRKNNKDLHEDVNISSSMSGRSHS